MRTFPFSTVLAGFVAVLVGYASSAAIIWQAAAAAGADAQTIAGWMTALGVAMGASTLLLTLWRKVPVLTAWIQMLAGLALLGTISGSPVQALNNEQECDAAIVTFLVTASGVTLAGIGSAFWGLVAGGICFCVLSLARSA